jgi:hypothetical protein
MSEQKRNKARKSRALFVQNAAVAIYLRVPAASLVGVTGVFVGRVSCFGSTRPVTTGLGLTVVEVNWPALVCSPVTGGFTSFVVGVGVEGVVGVGVGVLS